MEIGIYTFGDITPDWKTGRAISVAQRYAKFSPRQSLRTRPASTSSASASTTASICRSPRRPSSWRRSRGATKRIRLTSAVTILSHPRPGPRVPGFRHGRPPLRRARRADRRARRVRRIVPALRPRPFRLRRALLRKARPAPEARASERVTWEGRFRPPLHDAEISPRPAHGALPIWVGTGGNPQSAANAARLGLPLTLANISLPPATLAPQVADYKRIGLEAGHDPARLRVALAGHMHIEEDSQARPRRRSIPTTATISCTTRRTRRSRTRSRASLYDKRAAADGPALRRQPAADRRQDALGTRVVRPPALSGAGRYRRAALRRGRADDRAPGRKGRAGCA